MTLLLSWSAETHHWPKWWMRTTVLNERLANHYGIDGVEHEDETGVAEADRSHWRTIDSGLITSGQRYRVGAPRFTVRCGFAKRSLMTGQTPAGKVPALVDTAGEDAADAITIKDLLRLHRQKESCNDCHVRLDPWGIPFERYNAVGQYQPLVPAKGKKVPAFNESQHGDLATYLRALKSVHSVPVDAAAKVPHGPKIDGMAELKEFARNRHKDIQTNVVRRLLTYAMDVNLVAGSVRNRATRQRDSGPGGGFQDAIWQSARKLLVE